MSSPKSWSRAPTARWSASASREIYAGLAGRSAPGNAIYSSYLLLFSATLFRRASGAPRVLAAGVCDHVLVDEFQDTNAAQYRLVKQARPPRTETSSCRSTTIQGYLRLAWGRMCAHALVSADFPRDDPHQSQQNSRSHPVILDAGERRHRGKRPPAGKTCFTATQGGEPVTAAHRCGRVGTRRSGSPATQPPGGRLLNCD